jgi:hypothetical protein
VVNLQIPMDSTPEIAAALGRFVAHWGILEGEIKNILEILCGLDQFRGSILYDTFPALGQKLGMLERLTHAFVEDGEGKAKLLHFIGTARGLMGIRNDLVHAVWGVGGDGNSLTLFPISLPDNKKKRVKDAKGLTSQDIQNETEKVRTLSFDIQQFRFRDAPKLPIRRLPIS